MTAVSLKGGLSIHLELGDPHRWSGRSLPLGRAPMWAAVPRVCVFFATASSAAAARPSLDVGLSDRDEASAAVARVPTKAAGPRSAADVAVGHLCGRFARPIGFASKLCRSALRRRRAPHACEFVHGWSEAARAANFETLAAYGRLYLNARARHSSGASTGRPDPLLSPSRRPHGVGAAPWA